MIKPALKALPLSFMVFAVAAVASASEQAPLLQSAPPAEWARPIHWSQTEIDRGWERQQKRLEARLAAKGAESVVVPGAIIVPLFPTFAPHRDAAPQTAAEAPKSTKSAAHRQAGPSDRD